MTGNLITRRDLVNGVLVGAGVSLLGRSGCAKGAATPDDAAWTGYGGVGDYAQSNGNTRAVMDAAHAIRDAAYEGAFGSALEEDPVFDVVIIGAGFAGLSAAHEVARQSGRSRKCLVLENHPVFGGEAKQNEFDVDGHRLYAPQGSNDFSVPEGKGDYATLWAEIGMPERFSFASTPAGTTDAPLDNYGPMYWEEKRSRVGFYFRDGKAGESGRWVADSWRDGFKRAPIPEPLQRDLHRLWTLKERPYPGQDFETWLDGMTYRDFLLDVLKLSAQVVPFVDPLLAASDYGFGADVISAYAAYRAWLPGVRAFLPAGAEASYAQLLSFPGGNSAIVRHLVKKLLPDSIAGTAKFEDVLTGRIDFAALDRPDSWLRVRVRLNGYPHRA